MKETILVVDDEEVSRFVLREALVKRGYAVEVAPDAETAIRVVSQRSFDLILLDIQLPGLSGIEAISKFKEIDPTDGFSEGELRTLKALLSPDEAKHCLEMLLNMRTLDPAVGSGAFPVGLLHELISLQRIFETAAHGYDDPVKGSGTRWM